MSGPVTRTAVLGGIWADSAEDPPESPISGTTYADSALSQATIEVAWPYKIVADGSDFNEYLRRMSTLIDLCEKWGVMPWSLYTPYSVGAVCLASDGGIYQCIAAHSNKNPTSTGGYWVNLFAAHVANYHISFSARRNVPLTLSRNTWSSLAGHTVRDMANVYNPVSGRFVAPANGEYVFSSSASIVGADNKTRLQLAVRVNDSVVAYGDIYPTFLSSNPQVTITSDPIYMLTGHYAEAFASFQNESSPVVSSYALNLQAYANTFSGWRVS
jgi:hypothetical protein